MAKLYKEFLIREAKTVIFLMENIIETLEGFGSVRSTTPDHQRAELGMLISEIRSASEDGVMRELRRRPVDDTSLESLRTYILQTYSIIPTHWEPEKTKRFINLSYLVFGIVIA